MISSWDVGKKVIENRSAQSIEYFPNIGEDAKCGMEKEVSITSFRLSCGNALYLKMNHTGINFVPKGGNSCCKWF